MGGGTYIRGEYMGREEVEEVGGASYSRGGRR